MSMICVVRWDCYRSHKPNIVKTIRKNKNLFVLHFSFPLYANILSNSLAKINQVRLILIIWSNPLIYRAQCVNIQTKQAEMKHRKALKPQDSLSDYWQFYNCSRWSFFSPSSSWWSSGWCHVWTGFHSVSTGTDSPAAWSDSGPPAAVRWTTAAPLPGSAGSSKPEKHKTGLESDSPF